ncbi:MAG: hypothetical protein U0U69_13250 [Acidimicrobiia bacterium]
MSGDAPSVPEVASAYVDGELGAEQAAWVDANRGTDAALAAEIDDFARVKSLVGGLGVATPADADWDTVYAGVRRGIAVRARSTWVVRVSAAAAAVVLVAAVALAGVLVAGRYTPDATPQAVPALLTPSSTRSTPRSGSGTVAAARGVGSVLERVGLSQRHGHPATSTTTTTRPPIVTSAPSR